MSRWRSALLAPLAVALAALLPSLAAAQVSGSTNGTKSGAYRVEAPPPAYHSATVGRAGTDASAYARGYDSRTSGAYLHTAPTMASGGSAPAFSSASPYSASTFTPYYSPYAGWGRENPTGAALQGLASLTSATGQYYKDVQTARISREQSRQMSYETTRQRLQLEMDYEKMRPTAPKMMAQQKATDLDWARKYATRTEISSGSTLNVLLKSVLETRSPSAGPNIALEASILRGINLTDKTTRGNLSLTKDAGKIAWTEALEEAPFDTARDSFSKNFTKATEYVNSGKSPDVKLVRELRGDLKKLDDKLEDEVASLAPSRYIESRRLLNQLKDTVKGLSDPRLCKACNNDWRKNVRNVSELVTYCMKNGVEFGPAAAPEDYSAYSATYYALRSYEQETAGNKLTTAP